MTDQIHNITIRIADLPRMPLAIPAGQESLVRRAEESINSLWSKWRQREEFRDKSSAEILAMVTFRFAQLYYDNIEAASGLDNLLDDLEQTFDRELLNQD